MVPVSILAFNSGGLTLELTLTDTVVGVAGPPTAVAMTPGGFLHTGNVSPATPVRTYLITATLKQGGTAIASSSVRVLT